MFIRTRRVLVAAGLLACLPALLNPADALLWSTSGQLLPSLLPSGPAGSPAAAGPLHPGVQTLTEGGQCTANFVFTDTAGGVYLGQAAHCSGTGEGGGTNGCDSGSRPLGTPVEVTGASRKGTLAYNSWLTMQARGETDQNACQFNDFALVKLDPADAGRVNPSVPFFGGPTGLATTGTRLGDAVYSYGNSSLRGGLSALSPKRGVSVGDEGDGWSHLVYTVTPGVPGDSGSAFLDASGKALGVLSTLQVLPVVGSNGVGDLSRQLAYLNAHSGLPTVTLVPGTEPFRNDLLL
ncbi:MAG: serine protease [Actinomycetota bacterium]|nr:serine protease [Actinomycetota bacterium]